MPRLVLRAFIKVTSIKCINFVPAQYVVSDSMDKKEDVVENILRGLSSQIAEREDAVLCSDVRNKLFGPMEFSRRDLASLNIMRGRDNGLPDYNTVLYLAIEIVF